MRIHSLLVASGLIVAACGGAPASEGSSDLPGPVQPSSSSATTAASSSTTVTPKTDAPSRLVVVGELPERMGLHPVRGALLAMGLEKQGGSSPL